MSLRDKALEEAAITVLDGRIGDHLKKLREEMTEALVDADIDKQGVRLPDGTKVASISVTDPEPVPEFTDEEKFVDWVAQHAPGEVTERTVTIREVRPAYRTALVTEMTKRRAAETLAEGGEIIEIPGVKMKERARSHSLRFEGGDEGRAAIEAAHAAGLLKHLAGLRMLTGGAE